ncbi:MAG TPA: DUF305 domain-containing protein [Sphingomonas sp.]|nr:DUF305 domain-containing protein [Sphingomonas sp.]
MKMGYGRFAAMVGTSTVVMFILMYQATYLLAHVEYSQSRMWMAIVMGAVMGVIMLGFMWSMYKSMKTNLAVLAACVVVFGVSLWLVRSQETVGDIAYMKAMIPHHSMAILTSERAEIRDPEVRVLADRIVDSQVREIREMKRLIAELEAHPVPEGAKVLPSYRDRGVAPPPPETDEEANVNTLQPAP